MFKRTDSTQFGGYYSKFYRGVYVNFKPDKGNVIDPETGKKACATIEGHISKWKPDLSGMEWQTSFNDFTGGVGVYDGLTYFGKTMVLTECWGLAKIPGGYAAACGQGIEGCQVGQLAQSLVDQCKTDPRSNWRGAAVAVGNDGKMDWYRLDNWDDKVGQTASSAYEWISYNGA